MRLSLTILVYVAAIPFGTALADDGCFVPMADWKPRETAAAMAAELGWAVRRIKIDDGCYEIMGTDAEGRQVEATVNPSTLEILDIEYEDDVDHDSHGGKRRPND
jgi:hypothetical protein